MSARRLSLDVSVVKKLKIGADWNATLYRAPRPVLRDFAGASAEQLLERIVELPLYARKLKSS